MIDLSPTEGPSEVLIYRRGSSPLVAAAANAAASQVAEQGDVHNGSVFHLATVIFPPALAIAQALGQSGRELVEASVAGYEVGIRVGEFLGRSHHKVFHTTGTAGTAYGSCMPSARPARSWRARGNFCALRRIRSNCTRHVPRARD